MKNYRLIIVFLILLPGFNSFGQEQWQWYYFPLQVLENSDGDTLYLQIDAGSEFGIEKGANVSIWGLSNDEDPKHSDHELGAGYVDSVNDSISILRVHPVDTIYNNDLAAIYLKTPRHNQEIVQVIRYSINFINSENKPFYNTADVYNSDDPKLQERILTSMIDEIKTVAEEKRGEIEDQDITFGRFRGSSMFNQLDSVNARLLKSCLRYYARYPATLAGRDNNITVVYATWVLTNYNFTDEDIYDYLLEAIALDEVDKFADQFQDDVSVSNILDWSKKATNLDPQEGIELIDGLIKASTSFYNDKLIGWSNYYKAKIEESDSNPTANSVSLANALSSFIKVQDAKGLAYTYIMMGENFDNMNSYENSLPNYQKALINIKKFRNTDQADEDTPFKLGYTLYSLAKAHANLDHYDSAIYYYNQTLQVYTELDNHNSINVSLDNLAKVYAKSGDFDNAIEACKNRIELNKDVAYKSDLADTYFDLGYVYNGYFDYYDEAIPYYQKSYELHLEVQDTSMAILSISNVGQTYWSLKILDKAIENHEKAIELAEISNDTEQHISSLEKLADLYKENGNPKKGLETYNLIISLVEKSGDSNKLVDLLVDVGDVYKDAKDYLKSRNYYEKAIRVASDSENYSGLSTAYYNLANSLFNQSKYSESGEYYKKSLEAAEIIDNKSTIVSCMANIGVILGIHDQYDQADSIISYALELSSEINNESNIAFCNYKLAGTAARKMEIVKSDSLYEVAFNQYKNLGNSYFQSVVLQDKAWLYHNQGRFNESEEILGRALKIAEDNNDTYNIASCLALIADLQGRIYGEFDKAWKNQMKAREIYEEMDNTWGIASSHTSLGNIYNLRGDNKEAIEEYVKSDSLFQIINSQYNRTTPINNIGTIYMSQGDYAKALKQFQKALSIIDSIGIKDESHILYVGNTGRAYYELGEEKLAEKWLKQSIKESRESNVLARTAYFQTILGALKTDQKEYELAEKYLLESHDIMLDLNMKTDIGRCQVYLGKLYYEKHEMIKALEFFSKAVQTSNFLGIDKYLWESYYYQGLIAKEEGNLEKAKELFISAIESLERIQSKIVGGTEAKKIFASGEMQVKVYSSMVDILIELGEVELALQYLERSNVESLRNKFSQLDIQFKDEEANEVLTKERELKKKLDNLERTLAEEKSSSGELPSEKIEILEKNKSIAENEYLKFVNTTINSNPELARHFSGGFHPRKLKIDKNRRLIPEDLIVLSYLPGNDKLYIFAATSDTVIAKVIDVSLEEIHKNINYIYNFTSKQVRGHHTDALRIARGDNPDPLPKEYNATKSNYKEISEELHSWLLAPVIEEINKKSLVAVIPTGVLHFLPFQQLGKTQTNGKFEYFIEHHTLFYAHTLEMLYQPNENNNEISILAFGNADNSLPASEEEVNDLKVIYPDSEVLIRDAATEERVKTYGGEHNILHFATHGNLDYYDYNKSYLTLAPNEVTHDDGKLTIEEVWEIEDIYSYQMVTLSACQTAVTNDYSTGWAVSPASSFIDAGAPTVVASLWAVNDASTALLMKYFYENLKTMSKVEALRLAQIKLSNHPEYSHPYYWSPFILIGNWK